MITERGSTVVLYANFVTTSGEAATIVGIPTVTIYHREGTSTKTDVNAQNMTQVSGSLYFYRKSFNTRAYIGDYTAQFNVDYNTGESVVGNQDFQIVEKDSFNARRGGFTARTQITPLLNEAQKKKLFKALEQVDKLAGKEPPKFPDLSINSKLLNESLLKASLLDKKIEKLNEIIIMNKEESISELTKQIKKVSNPEAEAILTKELNSLSNQISLMDKEFKDKNELLLNKNKSLMELVATIIPDEVLEEVINDG